MYATNDRGYVSARAHDCGYVSARAHDLVSAKGGTGDLLQERRAVVEGRGRHRRAAVLRRAGGQEPAPGTAARTPADVLVVRCHWMPRQRSCCLACQAANAMAHHQDAHLQVRPGKARNTKLTGIVTLTIDCGSPQLQSVGTVSPCWIGHRSCIHMSRVQSYNLRGSNQP
eukprot:358273-Chlamydomonas_euryale.AAC.5